MLALTLMLLLTLTLMLLTLMLLALMLLTLMLLTLMLLALLLLALLLLALLLLALVLLTLKEEGGGRGACAVRGLQRVRGLARRPAAWPTAAFGVVDQGSVALQWWWTTTGYRQSATDSTRGCRRSPPLPQ